MRINKKAEDIKNGKHRNNINSYVSTNGLRDYSNTWFHNAINVKHDSDLLQANRYLWIYSSVENSSIKHKIKSIQSNSEDIKAKLQRNSKQK